MEGFNPFVVRNIFHSTYTIKYVLGMIAIMNIATVSSSAINGKRSHMYILEETTFQKLPFT